MPVWRRREENLRLPTCAVLRDGILRELDSLASRRVCRVAAGVRVLRSAVQFDRAFGSDRDNSLSGPDVGQRDSEERFQGQALQFAEDSARLRARRGSDASYCHRLVDLLVVVVWAVK